MRDVGTDRTIGIILAFTVFLVVCMPWLANAESAFPTECVDNIPQDLKVVPDISWKVEGDLFIIDTTLYTTDCTSRSPSRSFKIGVPMKTKPVPEPGAAVSMIAGALAVYTLRRGSRT